MSTESNQIVRFKDKWNISRDAALPTRAAKKSLEKSLESSLDEGQGYDPIQNSFHNWQNSWRDCLLEYSEDCLEDCLRDSLPDTFQGETWRHLKYYWLLSYLKVVEFCSNRPSGWESTCYSSLKQKVSIVSYWLIIFYRDLLQRSSVEMYELIIYYIQGYVLFGLPRCRLRCRRFKKNQPWSPKRKYVACHWNLKKKLVSSHCIYWAIVAVKCIVAVTCINNKLTLSLFENFNDTIYVFFGDQP